MGRFRRFLNLLFGERPGRDCNDALSLARWYLARNRLMEAMVVAKRGLTALPSDRDLRLVLARVFIAKGKKARAVEELESLLACHPGDAEATALRTRLR